MLRYLEMLRAGVVVWRFKWASLALGVYPSRALDPFQADYLKPGLR